MGKFEGAVATTIGLGMLVYGGACIAMGVDALDGFVGKNNDIPATEILRETSAGSAIAQGTILVLLGLSIGIIGVQKLRGVIK